MRVISLNLASLKPASEFALKYGVKAVIFGPPGSGKTPTLDTAPRPVLCCVEPGMLSMRHSKVPTWGAFGVKEIEEFKNWVCGGSAELKNFDTIGIDSISFMAEIYLQDAQKNVKHGLQAYGDMATKTMDFLRKLYFMPEKHLYLIAKQEIINENGLIIRRPYFPGKQLPIDVPHLFDEVLYLNLANIPNIGTVRAFRCQQNMEIMCRDRTGMLAEYEEPHFGKLITKCIG